MIEATGGKTGVRDIDLLESALFNAFVTFDGIELYPGVDSLPLKSATVLE
jgi:hypothetical protein